MIFQIAGLPRSGTAWIASVLNLCPDIMCIHEPVDNNVPAPKGSYSHSGQSGSHLLVPSYRDMEADLRIFIKRDSEDCVKSLQDIYGDVVTDSWMDCVVGPSIEYENKTDIIVNFENLFTEDAVKYIWESITEIPFCEDKVAPMFNMNIQRHSLEYDFDESVIECFNKD